MKIYTKTGDQGETGLLGGLRVSKSHPAIKACGSLDETNSVVGLARTESLPLNVAQTLEEIQHDLFDVGSRVAACLGNTKRATEFPISRSEELEKLIDQFQEQLTPLEAFILPSGSRGGSTLHFSRSVCRRAERELVELIESGIDQDLSSELIYLNRLGDLLFVLARSVNQLNQSPETKWDVDRQKGRDS